MWKARPSRPWPLHAYFADTLVAAALCVDSCSGAQAVRIRNSPQSLPEKTTFDFHGFFRGLPLGRRLDSRPNSLAACVAHSSSP